MEVAFGFVNICSFITIWIFNLYSWIVSAVLCTDGVLSVPATKAFPKSQTLGNFPCKFIFAHFRAVSTEATKAATFWLCFVWHLIPYPGWHEVTQLRDNQTHALPLFQLQNVHLLCRGPEGFPREWDPWDVFRLLSHLDSTLIYLPGDKCNIFHSVDSGEDVHPIPCSTAPLSACPLWIHTSWLFQVWRCWQFVCRSISRPKGLLGSCPQVSTAQPVLEPTSSLRKGFVTSFQWTHCDWEFRCHGVIP